MKISNPTAVLGENLACEYLKKKNYKIIERNFRKGYGEIDIICIKNKTLIFVEVKTRTSNLYGGAMEAISYSKLQKLIKIAEFYKLLHPELPEALRIDAILIDLLPNQKPEIKHIENITV